MPILLEISLFSFDDYKIMVFLFHLFICRHIYMCIYIYIVEGFGSFVTLSLSLFFFSFFFLPEKISPRPTSNLQVDQNSSLWGRQWGSRGRTCSPTPAIEFLSPPDAKFHSISAMPFFQRKSHEEIRWEDYQSQGNLSFYFHCV